MCVVCGCCFIIFGIIGLVYYEKSFLDIKHECEIYNVYTTLCHYACGHYCTSRLSEVVNDTNIEIGMMHHTDHTEHHTSHCHTRYCWGYRYNYDWKTMDWKSHPYKVDIDESVLHGYINSPFDNMTPNTENKLKTLLEHLNNDDIQLTDEQLLNVDLREYIAQNMDIETFVNDDRTDSEEPSTTNMAQKSSTKNKYDVDWCDYKRPAYITRGSCGSFPYQWHSRGDAETCYTNNRCSSFSTNSPTINWDVSQAFGWSAMACAAIFVLTLLYWFICWMYDKCCGYDSYDRIPTVQL